MAGRRTNLALLVLLVLALSTGLLSWAAGPSLVRWLVIAHGVTGLAIVVLAPWKQSIARRGLARPRAGRSTSIAFVVLIVTSVVAAFVHVSGIVQIVGTFSPLGIHVATAFVAVAFAVVHVLQRTVRPRATDLSRRNLLRGSVLLGGAGLAWLTIESILRATDARGAQRRITGSFETGSDVPTEMPVTQWLNDTVQDVDAESWRLHVTDGARSYSVEDLFAFGDTLRATLDCTGGWYAEQEWRGARLDRLIDGAQGWSIVVRSATGYSRRFPLSDAATLLIATEVGGERLSPGHGAPARLVAPGRRGFWWVKWVTTIELDEAPWWWQPPFPLT
ncbi:MAG: molybdopterin-dependent oxidoreductase [Actinomycetota bacterium]|nr:molybdopterin-dependent oxidoreductase [Actinomycetota bacterium]